MRGTKIWIMKWTETTVDGEAMQVVSVSPDDIDVDYMQSCDEIVYKWI